MAQGGEIRLGDDARWWVDISVPERGNMRLTKNIRIADMPMNKKIFIESYNIAPVSSYFSNYLANMGTTLKHWIGNGYVGDMNIEIIKSFFLNKIIASGLGNTSSPAIVNLTAHSLTEATLLPTLLMLNSKRSVVNLLLLVIRLWSVSTIRVGSEI
jgi:hypothetical protein